MRRRRVRIIFASVLASVLLAGAAAGAVNRARFGTFAFWGLPDRVDYCGRRYYISPKDVEGTTASFLDGVSGQPEWRTVTHTLTGRAIKAAVPRERIGSVCAMVLYVRTGDHSYRPYPLSGGP